MHGPTAGSPPVLPSGKMVMWALAQVVGRPGSTISEVETRPGQDVRQGRPDAARPQETTPYGTAPARSSSRWLDS